VRWDQLLPPWIALLEDDGELVASLGGSHIYPAQASRAVVIPSIEYQMISDREAELFGTIALQVDYWARGIAKAGEIERRLRTLLHHDVAFVLGGERLWSRYVDSRTLSYPADPGVLHRALDFEIEAARGKYVPLEES
jgi:hypothetical protein